MSSFYLDGAIGVEMNLCNTNRPDTIRELDESALIAAAQAGNAEAFEALLQPHSKRVLRAIRGITRNREDAEDALQNAILRAFTHIRSFDGRSKFSTWLTRIAINSALILVRAKNSTLGSRMESYDGNVRGNLRAFPDRALNPEAAYLRQERSVRLRRAIGSLGPTIRKAFSLHKVHELSLKETAETLGLSIPAVKSRLFRARTELRRSLAASSL
jgi:RNA polymerase sigma-70 factor (ECF subfamily)